VLNPGSPPSPLSSCSLGSTDMDISSSDESSEAGKCMYTVPVHMHCSTQFSTVQAKLPKECYLNINCKCEEERLTQI